MEKQNFNTAGFFEPTEKYIQENTFEPKLWFNIDLIGLVGNCTDDTDREKLEKFYKQMSDFYGIKIPINEVFEKFKDYPKADFDKIVEYLIKNKPCKNNY